MSLQTTRTPLVTITLEHYRLLGRAIGKQVIVGRVRGVLGVLKHSCITKKVNITLITGLNRFAHLERICQEIVHLEPNLRKPVGNPVP